MFSILEYSNALEYSIIMRYTNIVYYYYYIIIIIDLVCDGFVLSRQELYVGMIVCISLLHLCLCYDVMVMSSA